jgi:putative transposase
VSVSLGEQELHWRDFLQSLVERGLNGVELIISDAHVGFQAARKGVFSGVPWQRCQFHLQQNASQYVPRQSMKREVAADIRAIFNAPDRAQAESQLRKTVEKHAHSASKLFDWLEGNIPVGLTVFFFSGRSLAPDPHSQQSGASVLGNPTTDSSGCYLPQRGFLFEVGEHLVDGDQ